MPTNLEEIKSLHLDFLPSCQFDHLAFSCIDFKSEKFTSWIIKNREIVSSSKSIYFDLASLTKPLTLGTYYLKNQSEFTEEQVLLLEHRAGLPAYGSLSNKNWKQQILDYSINGSATLYSDFSSLRLMLELGQDELKQQVEQYLTGVKFWKELSTNELERCPQTGFRLGRAIRGSVHDPNAYTINEFCSHSGLFGTIDGVSKTLLSLNSNFDLLEMQKNRGNYKKTRDFYCGWEGISDPGTTLAGKGAGKSTFGFLGFTGTSFWIDPEKQIGWVLLTNATQKYWYDRSGLNSLRRRTGELVFNN